MDARLSPFNLVLEWIHVLTHWLTVVYFLISGGQAWAWPVPPPPHPPCFVCWSFGVVEEFFLKKGMGEMVIGRGECWAD